MTPREKQAKFRRNVKEIITWGMIMIFPVLMVADWIFFGYR